MDLTGIPHVSLGYFSKHYSQQFKTVSLYYPQLKIYWLLEEHIVTSLHKIVLLLIF